MEQELEKTVRPKKIQQTDGSFHNVYEKQLNHWIDREKSAIAFAKIAGELLYNNSVELTIFRNPLIDISASKILYFHEYARNVVGRHITIHDTLLIAKELLKLDLPPAWIDIGRLSAEWLEEHDAYNSVSGFVHDKLNKIITKDKEYLVPKNVVLYGFGRVGRIIARELIHQAAKGQQLRLRAIITRNNDELSIIKRAALLRNDSVHGHFPGTVTEDIENKALVVNGHTVKMLAANNPGDINLEENGISDALLIDNTGIVRDRSGLSKHLNSKGVSKVLLTAPGKGDVPNIVFGINHDNFDRAKENIFSAASCTTNAIVPVLEIIENTFGIEKGHIETIHAYTNDQNLLDNYHSKYRRGRSAPMNMVITETGAAKAVSKAIPALEGKLTANAVRVPTPNGSLAILNLTIKRETSVNEVNALMKKAALEGELVEQIQYSYSNELVSSDIVGNSCATVFDSPATIVSSDKKNIVLYTWYDNEYGYSRQVIRLAKHLANVVRLKYY